jgi:hypothetical protein
VASVVRFGKHFSAVIASAGFKPFRLAGTKCREKALCFSN